TLGSLLPSLIGRFGLDNAAAGSLFAVMSLGIMAGSIVFGPVVDRYGYKGLLTACITLILVGLEGLALAPTRALLVPAILLIGFGGGVVNGGTNALVADISEEGKSARLALVGVFFGIGALGMPFVLGVLLDSVSYTTIVAFTGVPVACAALYCALIRFPAPKQPQGFPLAQGVRLLRDPTLLLLGLMLFFESGMEITAGGWMAAYVQESLALPAERALFFISLYWAGMTVARLVLGRLLDRLDPAHVLVVSIGTALLAALLLIAGRSVATAAVGSTLLGAGFAGVFPIVLGFVGDRYVALSGTAFSVVIVMALMGGTALPWLTGVLGDAVGLRASFALIPTALIAMGLVFTAVRRGIRVPAPVR
ncbi:MAG: MFS transporter, partial [Longimicrobiales bacterium]